MASGAIRDGVFAINKPCGKSSANIVRECQKHFNPSLYFKPMIEAELARRLKESGGYLRPRDERKANEVKIGHGGTLDPLATGVLILGIGSGTKLLTQFLDGTKTYETIVLFGASTDTYDRVGRILTRRPYDHITREMVEKALENFRGEHTQIPPLYSALRMDGKRLYEYAREGRPIPREIEGRHVHALEVKLLEWYEPGTHNHRWPAEEAEAAERNLAEQVWSVKKLQETSKKLTAEEKEKDDQAIAAHESFKRLFEERQDELITDKPQKRGRHIGDPMMSGALGTLPHPVDSSKGSSLAPPPPDKNTPRPWSDEGPPACKIRLTVTSGYYVRSFCHDLGAKLESAAMMAELCRTRQSDFTVGGVTTLEYDDLARGEEVWGPQVANMLARWNGEPEGYWPGTPSASSNQAPERLPPSNKYHGKKHAYLGQGRSSFHKHDHRKRSPPRGGSSSPPRKVPARAMDERSERPSRMASGSPRGRSDKDTPRKALEG